MNYDFEVTIKRMINKTPHGTKFVFDGKEDLEEIFTPKIVALILKNWSKTLEERHSIIPCTKEKYRSEFESTV